MSASRAALRVKLSVLRAGASVSTILLTALASAALVVLVNRVFDGKWRALDWRLVFEFIGAMGALWFLVIFASNLLDLRASDRREETPNPSFGATTFIRIIFSANVGLSALLIWGLRRQHEPVWLQCTSLSFGLLAFFGWPRTITLDEEGISQRSLFGVRRTIPYREVEGIGYEPDEQATLVVGIGATIKHTACHSDAALFRALMEERTGKQV